MSNLRECKTSAKENGSLRVYFNSVCSCISIRQISAEPHQICMTIECVGRHTKRFPWLFQVENSRVFIKVEGFKFNPILTWVRFAWFEAKCGKIYLKKVERKPVNIFMAHERERDSKKKVLKGAFYYYYYYLREWIIFNWIVPLHVSEKLSACFWEYFFVTNENSNPN